MRLAEPFTRARQAAQREVMVANRAKARERPCGIKGCERAGGKRGLCAAHYSLVPYSDRVALTMACFEAQMVTAAKFYRRFVRQVQALENAAAPHRRPRSQRDGDREGSL